MGQGQPPYVDKYILTMLGDISQQREEAGYPQGTTVSNFIGISARKRGTALTVIEESFQEMLEKLGPKYKLKSNSRGSNGIAAAHTPGGSRTNQSKNVSQLKRKIKVDQRKLEIKERKLEVSCLTPF